MEATETAHENLATADLDDGGTHPIRFVARQPIFDLQQVVFGYELLFRADSDRGADSSSGATRRMIDDVLLLRGYMPAANPLAFVHLPPAAITERLVTALPAHMTVIELTATNSADSDVISACAEMKQLGYRIALDGLLPETNDRLVELADYVRLDLHACLPPELAAIRKRIDGTPTALLADKVRTEKEFHHAASEGCRLFQGYFIAKPSVTQSRVVPPNQLVYLQLLTELNKAEPDPRRLERLVMSEASLCVRVLRAVNTAAFGMRKEVTSVRHALMLLGDDRFRKMVTVAIASGVDGRFTIPAELILLALHRAHFCELMSTATQQPPGEQYLIGMLSVVDAILRTPMEEVVEMLPLRKEASSALLGRDEPTGAALRLVEAYEGKEWKRCFDLCQPIHLSEAGLSRIYVESLSWAIEELRKAGI